ncbi:MAG: DUF6356 family protein [Planctomycetota bacterium]
MNLLTDHPHERDLTYFEHLRWALWSGVRMIFSGLACVIHAFLPFLFKNMASNTVVDIYGEIKQRKRK